jgi:predicted amidophosphoribosyltransferase
MRAWKEHGLRRSVVVAADLVEATLGTVAADVITHIPADTVRQLQRGVHPAGALARELGRRWDVRHATLLRRTRPVARQTQLALADRRRNVAGAFAATGAVSGHVLLIDDVYTTGSTVDAAARELLRAGAVRVDVITFARTIRG